MIFIALMIASALAADPEVAPNPGAIVDGNAAGAAAPITIATRRSIRYPSSLVTS